MPERELFPTPISPTISYMGEPKDKEEIIRNCATYCQPSLAAARVRVRLFLSREDFRDIDIALLADDRQDQDSFKGYASEAGDLLKNR